MDWLTKERLDQLKKIMAEDYELDLSDPEAEEFAKGLIESFDLLLKADRGQKFEQRPSRFIDTRGTKTL